MGPIIWNLSFVNMDRALQKPVLGHMRTPKAQISLRICTVWAGPPLPANKTLDTIEYTRKGPAQARV